MTAILVADDHAMFRRGVIDLLRQHGVEPIEECATGAEALDRIHLNRYRAVILDLSLPDRSGLDILKQVRAVQPQLPVLIVSMHAEEQFAMRALRAGASGYVMKGASAEVLWTAVAKVLSGGTFVSPALGERLGAGLADPKSGEPHERLSDREFQVFRAIAAGIPARAIAEHLGLSVKTVNSHRMNVLAKLGLKSNAEVIRYAIERGLV